MKKTLTFTLFSAITLLVLGGSLVCLCRANPSPFGYPEIISINGFPDSKTKPPEVLIFSPTNGTAYPSSSLSLNYTVSIGDSESASVRFLWKIIIAADWLPNNITTYEFNANKDTHTREPAITNFSKTLNLTGIPEGQHRLIIHTQERGAYDKKRYEYTYGFITKEYVTNFFINQSSLVVFNVDLKPPTVSVLSMPTKLSSPQTLL